MEYGGAGAAGAAGTAGEASEPSGSGTRERDVERLLRLVREQQETYCVLYERNAQLHREWSASQLEVARLRAAARCLRGGRSGQ